MRKIKLTERDLITIIRRAVNEDIQQGCRPNPSTASFPFNAAGPGGGSYSIPEPTTAFKGNMKRLLSGNQGCTGLSTKMTQLGSLLQQIMSNNGPVNRFIVVLGKIHWLSSFITNNTNSGNGCANCGTVVSEDDGRREPTTKKQKTEPMTPAPASTPCPPNPSSPYHTYGTTHPDDFCSSDYCNPGNHPDCVCCGDSNPPNACQDPTWLALPAGGTAGNPGYNGGKNNYCDRCDANSNSTFPVIISNNTWQYSPSNGVDYCPCC